MEPSLPPTLPTRERILRVAEQLFAERGYNAVSLRTITGDAGVNIAAVHYHFGTKEALLRAIFEAHAQTLSAQRREQLDAVLARHPEGAPPVREILAAFLRPAMQLARSAEGAVFNRLSAVCSADPDPIVKHIVFGVHDAVAQPFVQALRRACPRLDGPEFFLRVQCVFGSMMYIRADNQRVDRLLPEDDARVVREHPDRALEWLLDFLAAGMGAPARG